MASQALGPNDSKLDRGAPPANGSSAPPQHTEIILDGPDDVDVAARSTEDGSPPTPPDPLALTIDYQPSSELPDPLSKPFPTLTDATQNGDVGVPSIATVRSSVPGYEILRELGRGGMGVVYQARHKGLNRLVALKMILAGDHAGSGDRERFRREAEAVAALQHPNIVQIHEIGEADGRPYLAFEYIEGGTLAQQLGGNPWPSRAAAGLIEVLARAVQFAHDRGIVHRDLKPGNVLMAGVGYRVSGVEETTKPSNIPIAPTASPYRYPIPDTRHPKITDFGLAKRVERESDWTATGELASGAPIGHTRTGAVMGTPSYIAPEQAAGKNRDVGPAADVYALGAILYELLTGRPPFRGETPLDTVLQVMSDDPVQPHRLQPRVPRDLETICLKCLQKSPAKRYLSAGDLADDLRRFTNHLPIEARPSGARERLVKWAKRHPARATSLFISIFALVTMLGISFYFNLALRRSAEEKEIEAAKSRDAQIAAEKSAMEKERQTRIARERLKEMEKAQGEAAIAHQQALKREEQAKRTAYALALNRAMALVERDPSRAALLLDKREECPIELRDFTWHYLRAMCRIDQSFLAGHTKTITQIAWSKDGARLATASWDGTVRIWDNHLNQAIAVLKGHHGIVRAIHFASDGRTLVSIGSDHHVNFWELPLALLEPNGGQPPSVMPWAAIEVGDVESLALAPDSKRVAVGGTDGKIRLLTLPALPMAGMHGAVGGLASLMVRQPIGGFAPDHGPALGFTLKPALEESLVGHTGTVNALVWTKEALYSGGSDRTVRRWKPGEKLGSEVILQNTAEVRAIDVSDELELLAVAGGAADDAAVKLWSLRQNQLVARLRGHIRAVNAVHFSPDGKLLASASSDTTVRLWDTAAGLERTVYRGHKEPVRAVAFSPDQQAIASGGQDQLVRIWTQATSGEQTVEINARSPLPAAATTADGRVLALAERDGPVKVWLREADGYPKASAYTLRTIPGRITSLVVSPQGDTVAAILVQRDEWSIAVWSLPKPKQAKAPIEVKSARLFKATAELNGIALYGPLLAVAAKNGLQIWNLAQRDAVLKPLSTSVRAVAFTTDGTKVVSASGSSIQVWDVATGREECLRFGHGREDIASLAVGPPLDDPNVANPEPNSWTVVSSDQTGASWVWSLGPAKGNVDNKSRSSNHTMALEHRAILIGHAEPITDVAFSTDGKTIATTSDDRTIRLWDPLIGRERAALTSHTDSVLLAAFLPDGAALMSISREGALKIWHAPR